MKPFWTSLLMTWVLLLVVAYLVPGIRFEGPLHAGLAALVLAGVNTLVRPLLIALTLPITLFTLGLFLLVINAFLFLLVAALVPGFSVSGFGSALLGSLLLSLLNLLIGRFVTA